MTAMLVTTSASEMPDGRPTGAYASELAECWTEFHNLGYDIALASIRGGSVPIEARLVGDPVQDEFFDGIAGAALTESLTVADVDDDFDVICVVGGHGAVLDLPGDTGLQQLVENVLTRGGVIAAVCHGVAALITATVDGAPFLKGRRVAAFTDEEESAVGMERRVPFLLSDALAQVGAVHVVAPPFLPHVVVDGRIVTGQNPASARAVASTAGQLAALPRKV